MIKKLVIEKNKSDDDNSIKEDICASLKQIELYDKESSK